MPDSCIQNSLIVRHYPIGHAIYIIYNHQVIVYASLKQAKCSPLMSCGV